MCAVSVVVGNRIFLAAVVIREVLSADDLIFKSGWLVSQPVSNTATLMFLPFTPFAHISGALITLMPSGRLVYIHDLLIRHIRDQADFTIHKKALLFYACKWIQGCCLILYEKSKRSDRAI